MGRDQNTQTPCTVLLTTFAQNSPSFTTEAFPILPIPAKHAQRR